MDAWRGIDEFVAVAASGTFAAAARKFGASTTHMSRSVALLESRLQAQLFHRTTRMVRLTDTGRMFYDHCRRLLHDRDEAIAQISARGEPQGELRVTCSVTMGERFVAPIIRRYIQAYPKVSVTLELTNQVVDLIADGYDLAIRTGNLPDSQLVSTRVAMRSLYTCAAPAYLARAGTPQTINDLAHHECVIGAASAWQFVVGQQNELFRPKGRWRCNSGTTVVDAVLAGMGICQVPDFYALPHLATGRLVALLEPFRANDEQIWAVYPEQRHQLPKLSMLVDRLRQELPAMLTCAHQPGE
jgi:DNA-binding transcriptional LysR family regulator